MIACKLDRSAVLPSAAVARRSATPPPAVTAPPLAVRCHINRSASQRPAAVSTGNLEWGKLPIRDGQHSTPAKFSIADADLPAKLAAAALSAEADIIETHGLEYWLQKDTGEYDSQFTQLAEELFGKEPEQLAARQRSNSKRLRRHNTLDAVIRREELERTNPQALLDRELYPLRSPVSRPLQALPQPINHPTLCSGETEAEFRRELGLPSIADDWYNPMTLAQREYDQQAQPAVSSVNRQSAVRQFLKAASDVYCRKGMSGEAGRQHQASRKVRAKHLRKYRAAIMRSLKHPPMVNPAAQQRLVTMQLAASRGIIPHSDVCQMAEAAGIPQPRVAFSRN